MNPLTWESRLQKVLFAAFGLGGLLGILWGWIGSEGRYNICGAIPFLTYLVGWQSMKGCYRIPYDGRSLSYFAFGAVLGASVVYIQIALGLFRSDREGHK